MRHRYCDVVVLPQDLQDFIWSAPMRDLAARVGLSDIGLKKLVSARGMVVPAQGHWNRVQAGRTVPECPKVPDRRPGQTGRIALDQRFASVLANAGLPSSAGPFGSANVPEDLEDLRAKERRAIGRVAVPRRLYRIHPGLAQIMKQEARRSEKFAASGWQWDAPKFASPVDQRRLRLLNALFHQLSRRGHGGDAYENGGEIHATALVGDTRVAVVIDLAGRQRRSRERVPTFDDLPAGTPLALSIDGVGDGTAWADDSRGRLETKLGDIIAGVIVAGEAAFRRRLKEAEERAEQFRRWEEQQRRERAEARRRGRLAQLRASGELLRQADDLRALVGRVRDAVLAGSLGIGAEDFEAWQTWAGAEADRLDPVLSSQVMQHLLPPHEE